MKGNLCSSLTCIPYGTSDDNPPVPSPCYPLQRPCFNTIPRTYWPPGISEALKHKYTGEYFTKKSIFCQGPRQRLSFFSEKFFGNFLIKLPYFWTICAKNAKFWIIWQNIGNIMIKIE